MFHFGNDSLKSLAEGGVPFFRGRKFCGRKDTSSDNKWHHESYESEYELYTVPTNDLSEASVVISETAITGWHMPVLDIDVEHALVPSSTVGHSHLYLNVACTWEDYVEFLQAAAKCGILEKGYVDVSIRKGYTAVRLPWVQRETPR